MANEIPFKATGYPLPPEQGEILTNGVLEASGTLSLAGDAKSTSKRKTTFPIWLGEPTAGPVGEGERKPVTGAEVSSADLNIKKFASIVLFTEEQVEDIQDGNLDVLVDSGVRKALAKSIDQHVTGFANGANVASPVFDSYLRDSAATAIEWDKTKADGLQSAISAAMGTLEDNGYEDETEYGVVLGTGFKRIVRDARESEGTRALYAPVGADPLYDLARTVSSNLNPASAASGKVVGYLVNRPNIHARLRTDVRVKASSEASIEVEAPTYDEEGKLTDPGQTVHLFQDNVSALLYEIRLGVLIHDVDRAVVPIKVK